jgi:hypothetical protein
MGHNVRSRFRRHTTPPMSTGCDEVNSEHVPSQAPRPAGRCRGRPSCSTESGAGLLDAARRQLSPDASCREIPVDTCRRVMLCLLTCWKLLLVWGTSAVYTCYWRRDSTLSTRLSRFLKGPRRGSLPWRMKVELSGSEYVSVGQLATVCLARVSLLRRTSTARSEDCCTSGRSRNRAPHRTAREAGT